MVELSPVQTVTKNKRVPRLLTVKSARRLTPNMIRVTFRGSSLQGIPAGREGANCKILLPEPGEPRDQFAVRLVEGPRPTTRTYTVRYFSPDPLELEIDFVAHGDQGPASAWAERARPGSFCGFAGPGTVKVAEFVADWYLLAADLSALPVASATLEAMPRDAKGVAVFEIPSEQDRQKIEAPSGIDIHWLIHSNPNKPSDAQERFIRSLDWPEGRVQTCIAGEHSVIKSLRRLIRLEKGVSKQDAYVSGYWKIGLVEDEHQSVKREENQAEEALIDASV